MQADIFSDTASASTSQTCTASRLVLTHILYVPSSAGVGCDERVSQLSSIDVRLDLVLATFKFIEYVSIRNRDSAT